MNAKEMFEKLGYKQVFYKSEIHYLCNVECIKFYLGFKQYVTTDKDGTENSWAITFEEHLAIHQQMKELGWIE